MDIQERLGASDKPIANINDNILERFSKRAVSANLRLGQA